MRILAIGDPHFKGDEKGRPGNKLQTDRMREATLEKIKKYSPDIVVILGDVLDRFERVSSIALTDAINWIYQIADISSSVFVLIGNHDRPSNDDFQSSYHPLSGIRNQKNITIVDKATIYQNYLFVPYVPTGRFLEAINTVSLPENWQTEIKAIFAHQEFKGSLYKEIESKSGDLWSKKYPPVISGHIHNYQRLKNNVYYVGTPMQHDFGDLVKKTISLFTFVEGVRLPEEKRISLGLSERRVQTMTLEEIKEWTFDEKYLWKIHIEGSDNEISTFIRSDKYRKLISLGVRIHTKRKEIRRKNNIEDHENYNTEKAPDFNQSIVVRIGNDETQLWWLKKILDKI